MFLIVLLLIVGIVVGGFAIAFQPTDYQKQMLDAMQKVDTSLYVLDYTYDYDIDDLLERGVSSTVDMVAYASKHLLRDSKKFEVNEGKYACSVFNAQTPEGDKIFGRNFDYYASPVFLVWLHPSNGYASINTVNGNFLLYTNELLPDSKSNRTQLMLSPYACMDGMNEKGLSMAILELDYTPVNQDNGKTDMTTSCIVRAVLDKCATVDEAIAMFNRYDMHDLIGCAYHYQITDATGRSVIIEYDVENVMHVYEISDWGNVEYNYQYLTNHYITYDKDFYAQEDCFGWDRSEKIDSTLNANKGIITEQQAMQLLDDVHLDQWMEGCISKVVTVWSSVYNMTDKTVTISVAMDYSKSYTFSLADPCKVL